MVNILKMSDLQDFTLILKKIIEEHGMAVFENSHKTHAILMDLANDRKRDRLLARHFVEAGGFDLLKRVDGDYKRINAMIIRRLREEFSIEVNAASWIAYVFAEAMGIQTDSVITLGAGGEFAENVPDPVFFITSAVAIGMRHTAAVLKDGTAIAHGRNDFLQCDVADWRNIVSIAAGDAHTVGLMSDGRVVAVGRNNHDQCDVGDLQNIAAIYAFGDDTICIDEDGDVTSCGKSKLDLSHFEQIRSIAWHPDGVYGIRHDGKVMMSSAGWEEEDWANSLTNVVQIISTYVDGSLVLLENGRVYKMGEPDSYFATIRDITAMVDLVGGFAVLRKDGMVRILPYDRNTPRKASDADAWQDVTAIFGKYKRLIGLYDDGQLVATCTDPDWLKRNGTLDFLMDWYPVGRS